MHVYTVFLYSTPLQRKFTKENAVYLHVDIIVQ